MSASANSHYFVRRSTSLWQVNNGLKHAQRWHGCSNNSTLGCKFTTEPLFWSSSSLVNGGAMGNCSKFSNGKRASRVIAQAGRSKQKMKYAKPGPERKRPQSGRDPDPAAGIYRRKPGTNQREPYTRHPDDYYKFGPYGPYSYKAPVVGKLLPVTSLKDFPVFMWSNVENLKEHEKIEIHDACVTYEERVSRFDESVGLQFFYVFVRLPFYVGPELPWKQWTLVSEITVESGETLDHTRLASRLNQFTKNKITKHTGWFRPDLVYVKPKLRRYQVRFEPQMDFIRELRSILFEPAGEPHEEDSYYGEFCSILGLNVNASHEEVTSKFEESSEETQQACLQHLLSKHPVQLLYHVPFPNRQSWTNKEAKSKTSNAGGSKGAAVVDVDLNAESTAENHNHNKAHALNDEDVDAREADDSVDAEEEMETFDSFDGHDYGVADRANLESDAEHYDENEAHSDDEEDDRMEGDDWDGLSEAEIEAKLKEGFGELREEEVNLDDDVAGEGDNTDLEDDGVEGNGGIFFPGDEVNELGEPLLKCAIRPYNYVNFIREMVMLRDILLDRKRSLQPRLSS